MKAIEINGEIKVYKRLPNSWKGVMGNFSMLSDEEIKAYGFYDVVTPDYNTKSEKLSDIFWDADQNIFTYNVEDRDLSNITIEELKESQIKDLKKSAYIELQKTDWYIWRKTEKNIDIPDTISSERDAIREKINTKESEINALTTKKDIMEYDKTI
tara:strand:+ start:161 stop:628 length:468 start_codon:yes stop_codon:yes gene_type:complete